MLDRVAIELESLGYDVRRWQSCIELMLPLRCSVRVSISENRLVIDPRCFPMNRTEGTRLLFNSSIIGWTIIVLISAISAYFQPEISSLPMIALGLVLLMLLATCFATLVLQYILTENAALVVREVFRSEKLKSLSAKQDVPAGERPV